MFNGVKKPAIAFLYSTFGTDNTCLRRFISQTRARGRRGYIHIHPTNETCRRLHRWCAKGEVGRAYRASRWSSLLERGNPKALRELRARFRAVNKLIQEEIPEDFKVSVSTGLEDDYTQEAFRRVLATARREIRDGVELVRSPGRYCNFSGTAGVRSLSLELHSSGCGNTNRDKTIYSNDGLDLYSGNGQLPKNHIDGASLLSQLRKDQRYFNRAFIWKGHWQGLHHKPGFTEPRNRDFRVSRDDSILVNKMIRNLEK